MKTYPPLREILPSPVTVLTFAIKGIYFGDTDIGIYRNCLGGIVRQTLKDNDFSKCVVDDFQFYSSEVDASEQLRNKKNTLEPAENSTIKVAVYDISRQMNSITLGSVMNHPQIMPHLFAVIDFIRTHWENELYWQTCLGKWCSFHPLYWS